MSKISAYGAITSVQADDLLAVVDVHDTTMAPSGTTKKMTLEQLLAGVILDGTGTDIQPPGVQAPGAAGKAADSGHVHPSGDWLPGDNGLQIANFAPASLTPNGGAVAAGVLHLLKLQIRQGLTLSKLWFLIGGAASGSSTGSFAGLYSSSGSLLTGSSDIGPGLTSQGPLPVTLTTPQNLAGGSFVWAALLANMSGGTPFMPQSWAANTALLNLGLTPAAAQFASYGTGQTALPASFTPAALTVPGIAWWVGAQ